MLFHVGCTSVIPVSLENSDRRVGVRDTQQPLHQIPHVDWRWSFTFWLRAGKEKINILSALVGVLSTPFTALNSIYNFSFIFGLYGGTLFARLPLHCSIYWCCVLEGFMAHCWNQSFFENISDMNFCIPWWGNDERVLNLRFLITSHLIMHLVGF